MKKNTTLVILAAGFGSRYGSLKQLDKFGPNGETIIDYSIYDAIEAGFNKIVFIIRKSFRAKIIDLFTNRYGGKIELVFVDQELSDIPRGLKFNPKRVKPWGTAHALWSAREVIDGPFGVINADDFYGRDAFYQLHDFLTNDKSDNYCVISYRLGNTLSRYGSVNRGVCKVDDDDNLVSIKETLNISTNEKGKIGVFSSKKQRSLRADTIVSMNMFGFKPSYFDYAEKMLSIFIIVNGKDPNEEFYIPLLLEILLQKKYIQVKSIITDSTWFGITYPEDKIEVKNALSSLHSSWQYPKNLWEHGLKPISIRSLSKMAG